MITYAQAAPILFDPPEAVTPAGTLFNSVSALVTALGSATPGDVLILANGTYNNVWVDINGVNGSPGNPIKVYAETPGQVFLTGSSQLSFINSSWVIANGFVFRNGFMNTDVDNPGTDGVAAIGMPGCSWYRITNCSAIHYENTNNKNVRAHYFIAGGTYGRVDHLYCRGKTGRGAMVGIRREDDNSPNYCVLDHVYVKEANYIDNWEAFQFGGNIARSGPARNLVHHNFVDSFSGESECFSIKSSESIFWANTLDNCQGFITNRQGHRNVQIGNAFIGRGRANAGGIRVTGNGHVLINNYFEDLGNPTIKLHAGSNESPDKDYNEAENIVIAHNTARNVNKTFQLGGGPGSTHNVKNIKWYNNLADCPGHTIIDDVLPYDNAQHTFLKNHFYWGAGNLGIPNPGNIGDNSNANLEFVNGLWRPSVSSTNIIALASKLFGIVYDFEDLVRGANPTIGCIEYSNSPGSGYTTAADVGPTYDVSGL